MPLPNLTPEMVLLQDKAQQRIEQLISQPPTPEDQLMPTGYRNIENRIEDRRAEFKPIWAKTKATANIEPYKYVVLHKPAINDRQKQIDAMKIRGVGYQDLINQRGLIIHTADSDVRPVHIKGPTHAERMAPTLKETRPDITNSNSYGIGVWGTITNKIKPVLFNRVANIYADHNIPLEIENKDGKMVPNYPVGHGQIQHSLKGAKWPRQTLAQGKEEGSDLQKLFIDNWFVFSDLVKSKKQNELPRLP